MLSLFRLLPLPLRLPVFYRLFARLPENRQELYQDAPLALVPSVKMRLLPGDYGHRPIAYTGLYEWPVTKRIANLARAGGLLIDVGANAGYFSLLWCSLHRGNRVEAFEALPSNMTRLRENVSRNGMNGRINLHPFALGKENGTIAFECGTEGQSGWGGIAATKSAVTIEVPIHRLDQVLKGDDRATVFKVDCEGADSWVIDGAREWLSKPQVRDVFFEVNQPRQEELGIPVNASQTLLTGLGFRCEQIDAYDWHAFKA